jgi:hypothetical protein
MARIKTWVDGEVLYGDDLNDEFDAVYADFPDQDLNTTDDVEFNSVEAGGFNDLTLEALATGFSLAGGTTPKTLTVDASMTASTVNTAVGKAHEHSNKTDIDKIGTGGGGAPTWNSAAWPIDPRFDWMFAVEEIAGDHSGNITIDPSDGHRQSISIDGNITGLTCALSATYPSIILELTTDGAHTIDLTGDEQAGTVDDSDIGAVDAPASLTYEYDVTTLLTGDKFKVTLPTSAQSEAAADTFEYTLPADYDETDFLAAFNDDDNWTGTLDGTFSIVGDELVFTYDDDGEQADLAEAALAYTLVAWAWETDGGEAIVLPDNGKCIIVLSLGADNTTKYAFLAATDIEVPT